MNRVLYGLVGLSLFASAPAGADDGHVLFNRDIRPIFSDTCFTCHGPDEAARKAHLRLDTPQGAFADREGMAPIVPGQPDKSEAYLRIITGDPDELMPPIDSKMALTAHQKELVRRWIEQGAEYEKHWSLIPPTRPQVPAAGGAAWARNPIDAFVLYRLNEAGLSPSPEAEKHTLIRRLHLDLTGLPPTPDELDAALKDTAPDWYGRLVDRLLQSPAHGERMTRPWLDAARYADTNGYQVDTAREMWLWRQWVIDAYNRNYPYDRFTIEQLAGDMLPNATVEQKIASGFNRNHRINGEGGAIPEEFLVEYIVDRVDTTGTVFMGLTLGCARCHDHKYDPITQREFFGLFAFFHNIPEKGVDGLFGPPVPFLAVPTPEQQTQLDAIVAEMHSHQATVKAFQPRLADEQAQWERSQAAMDLKLPAEGLIAAVDMEDAPAVNGIEPAWVFREGEAAYQVGLFGRAGDFDGKRYIDLGDIGDFEHDEPFSFGAWVRTEQGTNGAAIARMDESNGTRGYNLFIGGGVVHAQIISSWPDDAITQVSKTAVVKPGQWHHVVATYDGSGTVDGLKLFVDGNRVPANPSNTKKLTGSIRTNVPLHVGRRSAGARFVGLVDEARVYARELEPGEVKALAVGHRVQAILANEPGNRTKADVKLVRDYFVENHAPEEYRAATRRVRQLDAERKKLDGELPKTLVMEEMDTPRDTFMLVRGEYDKIGEKVEPHVPASLPPLPQDVERNRLTLANWLVNGEHPLTARVAVNRLWHTFFGEGLVRTTEDFGSQGQWPTHPELLDWMATEFVRSGWDTKAMVRLIVTSAAYRQSSRVTREMLERDPDNRFLARGPRYRMPAEMVRDNALAIGGLLARRIGGPSVKPYQPPKLWEELTSGGFFSAGTYEQERGEALYRRGIYTYWKRTIPPPSMAAFDAPTREVCSVQRQRTNTPLQALALMNDTIYVESARHLAQRMILEGGDTPEQRVEYGFLLATARNPQSAERLILLGALRRHLAEYRETPSEGEKLLSVGESPRDTTIDAAEHAAYTAVANLILNLDETITRE